MSLFPLLLAASLAAGNAEFEESSVRAAADIARARLDAETAERGLATNLLEQAMLADPTAFRTRPEAEARCRPLYRAELERVYRTRAEEILRGLALPTDAVKPDGPLLDAAAERHFAAAFDRDRAAACAAQAERIALKVKPDEAELEAKDEDEARAWLTRRIAEARGFTVFEENLKYISSQIVDPILADARRERKRQREYLMRTRSDAYAPEVLARELEANLRRNVAEHKAKCDDPERAWGVFPATLRAALPDAVERRVVALAVKDIDEVPFAPDADEVRRVIADDPDAHRSAAASEAIFRSRYSAALAEAAIAHAREHAPAAERDAFAEFLRAHTAQTDFARAVDARLKRETLPRWRALRADIVRDEARRLWPALVDRTWFPSAELADRMAQRSDYVDAVRSWRDTPDLAELAARGARALEETGATADRSVAAAFELARTALAGQRAALTRVHPLVLSAAKDLSKGLFASKPDLAAVTDMLTQSVTTEWADTRDDVLWRNTEKPTNGDRQHAELFPSVRREIELLARQILEELEKKEAAGEEAAEKTPDEPPPEEPPQPSEEKPTEELCTISFTLADGDVTVQAKRGQTVVAERRAKATASGFEGALRDVGAIVGREIFKLK